MKRDDQPRVFTIRPHAPFLPTLVETLFAGELVPGFALGDDMLALADIRIFVPTRRAARALRGAVLDALGGRAAILPQITPIGDVDEESHLADRTLADEDALPPNISDIERRIGITRLVLSWSRHVAAELRDLHNGRDIAVPASPADAARLADDLIRLMDQVATERADWEKLFGLVPEDYAQYWQVSLEFLKIVTQHWPRYLAERKALDPGVRRSLAIARAAARLREERPETPVIAAGSTGTAPATAELLQAVAGLPNGAVVLPGLDTELDDAAWQAIGYRDDADPAPSHPQYGMRQLLRSVGLSRREVVSLPRQGDSVRQARLRIVNEAMRPAETTDAWAGRPGDAAPASEAFAEVALIEARNEEEEALAVAIALREAVALNETAALVTPDRMLARRVSAHLERWRIRVDDSAGRPLAATPPAVLARLVAETALAGFEPVTLLALIKHPLARFGLDRPTARRAAHLLDLAVLRGPRSQSGSSGLAAALSAVRGVVETGRQRVHPAAARLAPGEWDLAAAFVARITHALEPLEDLARSPGPLSLDELVGGQVEAIARVVRDDAGKSAELADAAAGTRLGGFLRDLRDLDRTGLSVGAAEWPALFHALMDGVAVRPNIPADPRVSIWGPLEARLQRVDRIVLGGLAEGVWPAVTRSDPWLSRPMRRDLGLEAPERRIGLSAHDFTQAFGTPKTFLTRALTTDGAPSVASRWLQRLLAVIGDGAAAELTARGARYIALARSIDGPIGNAIPASRPEPKPPLDARPKKLSVTEIETLIRDPYAIYARHVLRLEPLDPVGAMPDLAERGTLLHRIFALFIDGGGVADAGALDRLLRIGSDQFEALKAFPDIHALWWPRFCRIAARFIDWERGRRETIGRSHTEIRGELQLPGPAGDFCLSGRADRVDERADGALAVLDYKTGMIPSVAQVETLFAPQLPLEAAIARRGGFAAIAGERAIAEIAYVALKDADGTSFHQPRAAGSDAETLAAEALAQLSALVAYYGIADNGYRSRARPMFERRYPGAYDHLARVKEWSLATAGDGE